ncbi:MAG: Nif3-like dinuclear metal center hexameric protein [Ignavibacteriales bacterium]|nr:Nif3-like dinuclear metal center hexameric protein [Ignavibacteriales bacterium]
MQIKDIVKILDDWAPPGAAWEKDNPGLQVGNPEAEVSNILLSLDTTEEIVREAIIKQCNVIISHHPLLYHSINKINTANDPTSRIIAALLKNDITLLSYHTNLDFTKGGVSFRIADLLELSHQQFLHHAENSLSKLVVYVPAEYKQLVAESLFIAGAGKIGEYERCSFALNGTGTFRGSEQSHPVFGEKLVDESVDEVRLEVIFDNWNTGKVLSSLQKSHPYEEPAYEIYQLKNKNTRFGAGVIGQYIEPVPVNDFLAKVKESLQLDALRFTKGKSDTIAKVAVCGGSGGDLLKSAMLQGADAFITADISYHTFHDADHNIVLIDAGHFETEIHILLPLFEYLKPFVTKRQGTTEVVITSVCTNPVKFYK